MSQEQQVLVGLAVGIIVLIWMIIKTKHSGQWYRCYDNGSIDNGTYNCEYAG